jgi:hypothetical protein
VPSADSQRSLKSMTVFSRSRILNACSVYVRAFASTSARVSCGLVVFFPDGSPIIAVKSPITNTTRWPPSWKCRILRRSTVCPRWMSGAEGSKPTLTVSGPRASLRERSSESMRSTAPRASLSRAGDDVEVTAGEHNTRACLKAS